MGNHWLGLASQEADDNIEKYRNLHRPLGKKWAKVLGDIRLPARHCLTAAILCENQEAYARWHQEEGAVKWNSCMANWFQKFSPLCAAQVVNNCVALDWVGVQPFVAPCCVFRRRVNDEIEEHPTPATSKVYRACWYEEAQQDLRSVCGLDVNVELAFVLATEIASELSSEIATDLLQNAGIKQRNNRVDSAALHRLSSEIHEQSGHEPNWMVCESELARRLYGESQDTFCGMVGYHYFGHFDDRNVYVSDRHPQNSVLMGYKGDDFNAGYFLGPYILVNFSADIDPCVFVARKRAMPRFAKRLLDKSFYGVINP